MSFTTLCMLGDFAQARTVSELSRGNIMKKNSALYVALIYLCLLIFFVRGKCENGDESVCLCGQLLGI